MTPLQLNIQREHDVHAAETRAAMPIRVQILTDGIGLTAGDRNKAYGDPIVNLGCAGELKAVLRKYLAREIHPGEQEAIDQVCTKLARVVTGAVKTDTYVDGATYFAIAGEIATQALDKLSGPA